MKVKVLKVNAFTLKPYGGNPAGVVLDSSDLSDDQMASISKELKVSETAFVFPSNKADFKVRFFTPKIEVDLCGHATIATFFTLGLKGFFSNNCVVTQETKAGIFPVDIDFSDDRRILRVMMTQGNLILKDIHLDISDIADSLNISEEEIDDSIPKKIVSTGLFTLPVCIKKFETLKSIKPDFEKIKQICNKNKIGSYHVFTFNTIEPRSVYHARNFAPVYGVNEDPVTGTANGAVCSYLIKHNIIQENNLVCEQGDIIRRPGRVFVEIKNNILKVGGKAVIVDEKEIKV